MQERPGASQSSTRPAKSKLSLTEDNNSNVTVSTAPSKVNIHDDVYIDEGEETEVETEIVAQVILPTDRGWGWIVVIASFWSVFILDGVVFCFGSIFDAITEDFQVEESLICLTNSVALALYYSCGPFTSALINRFGFRAICMSGATISSFSLFCTYFVRRYAVLCIFYGVFAGIGYCFINMFASLVVGFYFEKLRSLALAIATNGNNIGIMVMFPLNVFIVKLSDWRTLTLLHSGLFGILYFLGMTFEPLLSLTVTKITDNHTGNITFLPNFYVNAVKSALSCEKADGHTAKTKEKVFGRLPNFSFPTAAAVVGKDVLTNSQAGVPGPSTSLPVPKIILIPNVPEGALSPRQLKHLRTIMSKLFAIDCTIEKEQLQRKTSCWRKCCFWERHISQSRPMYRDDAFYGGQLKSLSAYQKSMMDASSGVTKGIEFQLAVSRVATADDLQEEKEMCSTAVKRVLMTMMDSKFLKRYSFLMVGASGFLAYLGYLIPYIFVRDRNRAVGIDEFHCTWFISAISFANAVGRLTFGALACKIDALKLFVAALIISGTITALSNLSFNLYYQYICWTIFGFFISCLMCLRGIILVDLYGLEKLTNATGLMLLFQGIGCCISTPVASLVKNKLGFSHTFYLAGIFMILSGVCLIPIKAICKREERKSQKLEKQSQNSSRVFANNISIKDSM